MWGLLFVGGVQGDMPACCMAVTSPDSDKSISNLGVGQVVAYEPSEPEGVIKGGPKGLECETSHAPAGLCRPLAVSLLQHFLSLIINIL